MYLSLIKKVFRDLHKIAFATIFICFYNTTCIAGSDSDEAVKMVKLLSQSIPNIPVPCLERSAPPVTNDAVKTDADIFTVSSSLKDIHFGAQAESIIGEGNPISLILLANTKGDNLLYGVGGKYRFNKVFSTSFSYTLGSHSKKHDTLESTITKEVLKDLKIKQKVRLLMLNVGYDFNYGNVVIPYIEAGAGYLFNKLKLEFPSASTKLLDPSDKPEIKNEKKYKSFAYSLGAGINYSLNNYATVGIGYNFLCLDRKNRENELGISPKSKDSKPKIIQMKKSNGLHIIKANLIFKF